MSTKITFRSGPERGDWLAVYLDALRAIRDKTNQYGENGHDYACAAADRAIQAMQERGEVGRG